MSSSLPYLMKTEKSKQLMVGGKPYLILAGELQNSSFTSAEYMETVWSNMVTGNINTVIGSVTWEMIEPQESVFDFSEVDAAIQGARRHNLRLILLWFGAFKNGVSTYCPAWVKRNPRRFARARLRKARGQLEVADVLSVFYPENAEADAKAFGKFMAHIKAIDEDHSTVIMVQVENEVGLVGDSRDASPAAESTFSQPVPQEYLSFVSQEWDLLHPDLKEKNLGFAKSAMERGTFKGTWEEAFGKSVRTDELFMAYYYALYVEKVAKAGRAQHPIPLFANVWQNVFEEKGDAEAALLSPSGGSLPGIYPSGGAVSNVLDIWQRFAPTLDFISPDIYHNDYNVSCEKYRHRNQPLFIPEQGRDASSARRVWIALGSHYALGTSPFGIDTVKADVQANPYMKHYGLLESVSQIVLEAQRRRNSSVGFCFDELLEDGSDPSTAIIRNYGGFQICIERCFVLGKPDPGAGMVIHIENGRFLLIGWGFQVRAHSLSPTSAFTGILSFHEKGVANKETGKLVTLRQLNGDETRGGIQAMMPGEDPDYADCPVAVTIPARTMIAEVEFYSLDEEDFRV
ncbi:glycoside hydrolase family 35 protein [Cadophora sp. DSE1049]|nr:glycoside hydrolase family 35 protein [Cadophora sp. DSE1049]